MSEITSPVLEQGNWQEAIDRPLQERLMRPLMKPGIIDTAQLAEPIIERSQRLNNRLPLVRQLSRRLSGVKNLRVGEVPIVLAQPLKSENPSASPSRKASGNSLVSQRTPNPIVQAKLTDSATLSEVSQMPVLGDLAVETPSATVVPHLKSSASVPSAQENASTSPSSKTSGKKPVSVSTPNPIVQAKLTDSATLSEVSQMPVLGDLAVETPSATVVPQPRTVVQSSQDSPQPRVQRKLKSTQAASLPVAYAQPLSGKVGDARVAVSSSNNLQLRQTQVNKLPVVQPKDSTGSNVALPQSSPPSETFDKIESPLPRVQVTTGAGTRKETQPNPSLRNQTASNYLSSEIPRGETTIGSAGLGTPLVLSVPPSVAAAGEQGRKGASRRGEAFGNNLFVKPIAYLPNASPVPLNSPPAPQPPSPPSVAGERAEGNSASETDKAAKIDVDALADKIERKLMRRLVVENERRGRGRWH